MSINDQQVALRNVQEAYADLQRCFEESREDYEFLWRQEALTAGGNETDATREMEGELFQLEMKLDRLEHEVSENAKKGKYGKLEQHVNEKNVNEYIQNLEAVTAGKETLFDGYSLQNSATPTSKKAMLASEEQIQSAEQHYSSPVPPGERVLGKLGGHKAVKSITPTESTTNSPDAVQIYGAQQKEQISYNLSKEHSSHLGKVSSKQSAAVTTSKTGNFEVNDNHKVPKSNDRLRQSEPTSKEHLQLSVSEESLAEPTNNKLKKKVKSDISEKTANKDKRNETTLNIEELLDRQYDDLMDEYRKLKQQKPSAERDNQLRLVLAVLY